MASKELIIFSIIIFMIWLAHRMFFSTSKVNRQTFPPKWRGILMNEVRFYNSLSKEDKDNFEQRVMNFLDKVTITGVETTIDDTDRLFVASSATIPIFSFPSWQYRNLNEVLLYDKQFNADYKTVGKERRILGMVGSGAMNRMMILSKPALRRGFEDKHSKSNVGIHEFIHLLDKTDGDIDGIPEAIMEQQYVIPWLNLMHDEIKDIKARKSDINPYGATNKAEFFSVASEYFFNRPHLFKKKNPELFELMEKVFRVD